jgi:hypothetical protein
VLITDKEPCKFAVNKRQNTNYSFLPVISKVSCIRRKRGQIICLQGNNKIDGNFRSLPEFYTIIKEALAKILTKKNYMLWKLVNSFKMMK